MKKEFHSLLHPDCLQNKKALLPWILRTVNKKLCAIGGWEGFECGYLTTT